MSDDFFGLLFGQGAPLKLAAEEPLPCTPVVADERHGPETEVQVVQGLKPSLPPESERSYAPRTFSDWIDCLTLLKARQAAAFKRLDYLRREDLVKLRKARPVAAAAEISEAKARLPKIEAAIVGAKRLQAASLWNPLNLRPPLKAHISKNDHTSAAPRRLLTSSIKDSYCSCLLDELQEAFDFAVNKSRATPSETYRRSVDVDLPKAREQFERATGELAKAKINFELFRRIGPPQEATSEEVARRLAGYRSGNVKGKGGGSVGVLGSSGGSGGSGVASGTHQSDILSTFVERPRQF